MSKKKWQCPQCKGKRHEKIDPVQHEGLAFQCHQCAVKFADPKTFCAPKESNKGK